MKPVLLKFIEGGIGATLEVYDNFGIILITTPVDIKTIKKIRDEMNYLLGKMKNKEVIE